MFYSHEILTDRKHGVATIWLVATLGSKSSLKKITRKAILDVDVPNACETITDPSAPLALRIQSSLLFGVSKVFSQQCAYMLSDMQSLRDKMRGITLLLRELEIDPNVVATRPEQLNLQADPDFNLELDLGFDLSSFDVSFSTTESSSLMSPRTLASSHTSFTEDEQALSRPVGLQSPSSRLMDYDFNSGELTADNAEIAQQTNRTAGEVPLFGDLVIVEDEMFDIDDDGSLVMRNPSAVGSSVKDNPVDILTGENIVHDFVLGLDNDDGYHVEQVGTDTTHHGHLGDHVILPFEERQNLVGDIDSDPLPRNRQPSISAQQSLPSNNQVQQSVEQSQDDHQENVTETATGATQQRTKYVKTIPIDDPIELSNRELTHWNNNYLDIMDDAHQQKAEKISLAQAKRNAAYWVLDQGIGDIDAEFRYDQEMHPLALFSGQTLIEMLSSSTTAKTGRKRSATAIAESDTIHNDRRVRARSDDQQFNGNDGDVQELATDHQGLDFGDEEVEPEIGREEQAPMPDHPDSMPWNIYASSRQGSRHGSARPAMSATVASSSAGRLANIDFVPSSVGSRRISRLLQESPLERRHRLLRQGSLSSTGHRGQVHPRSGSVEENEFGLNIDDDELDRQLAGNLNEASSFELYGPAAAVSTQEAGSSQWLAATLEQEAFNFLNFLQTTLDGKRVDIDDEEISEEITVTFDELLPPEDNSEIVAAQGLLHVLTLATKGLIHVNQGSDFGHIHLGIVSSLEGEESGVEVGP